MSAMSKQPVGEFVSLAESEPGRRYWIIGISETGHVFHMIDVCWNSKREKPFPRYVRKARVKRVAGRIKSTGEFYWTHQDDGLGEL